MFGGIETSRGRVGTWVSAPAERCDDARPLLFLHGVGSDKSVWAPQMRHFARTRRCIAADYPGYGDSAPSPGATREDFADAMLALLDTLGVEHVDICGLSLGGIVAMLMAPRLGNRLGRLVIANSFAVHPEGDAIFERSTSAARRLGMKGLADARIDMLLAPGTAPALRADLVATMGAIAPDAYVQGARAVWKADLTAEARAISAPTLVLCGSEDAITPPRLSDALADLLADARRVDLAGAAHLSNVERPDDFNREVEQFLSGAGGKAEGYEDFNPNL